LTPLGTSLNNKILEPLLLGPARAGRLEKPLLIIILTDGSPSGEATGHVKAVIQRADAELKRTRYGPDAASYQFAQIGNDLKAQKYLEELDNDPFLGSIIDCTSSYEIEQDEIARKSGGAVDLTPEMWLVKLLLGSVDS
jgi:hypothetical protein